MPSTALTAAPAPLLRGPLDDHDPGRVPDSALLALGPTLDGADHARYQLTDAHRMRHGMIVGDDHACVANLATVLAVTARAAMPLVTAYVAEHATNTALADKATVLITGEHVATTAVAALERAVAARAALLTEMQASSPCAAGLSAMLVLVDDTHRVFAPRRRWEAVLDTAAAVGIGVLATVPDARLRSVGGSSAVRALLSEQRLDLVDADAAVFVAAAGGERVLFRSFQLAPAGDAARVEVSRRRWLTAYPDTGLDAPTRDAFDAAQTHRGVA